MKELDNFDKLSEKDSIEQVEKKVEEVEVKFDSSITPMSGHTLFEINIRTGEARKAEYVRHDTIYWFDALRGLKNGWKDDVIKKKDCVYISALNKQNAIKRWKAGKGSAKIEKTNRNINIF